ncbi:Protein of unknown function [Williamsia sterculiae]|uniref:DUF2993 domain-containing protein n=1 Tax=Williamsia sterculiae TaxID=1344003 RepID=A0A1N7GZS6_9NOCA|nr:Protein of unknown function [Williamsia sterculiae]
MGLIVSLTAAALVLIVVIAGVGSELYLRNNVKNCLQQSFGSITGTSTSVSLSKTPMLWQWATGTVPSVQVDTNDSSGDTSAMKLHVKAEDLKNNDQGSTAKSIQGNGYLPFSRITDMSATQNSSGSGTSTSGTSQSGATITSLTGNAAAGTVTVKANASVLILDVPVTAELKPQLQNGKITFQAVKLSAFGIGVPSNIAQVIIDGLRSQLFPPLFDALNFQSLKVTDSGVEFVVDGTDVPLNSQTTGSSNTQSNSSSGACAA